MLCPACGALVGARTMDFKEWVMRCPACAKVSQLPGEPNPDLATETAAPEPIDELLDHAEEQRASR